MNNEARSNLTEAALYLEIYAARSARNAAKGTPAFAAAQSRVQAAFFAVQAFRAGAMSVAA